VSNLVFHIEGGIRPRVLENVMLRKIFGPKRNEITRDWRRRLAEDPCDLYSSSNIIRLIKLRRMRWAGHVALCGRGQVNTGLWWGNLSESDHLKNPGVDGRI
jgi:hypothetical protein